ncbi:MAG: tRNA pseudouridine(13) synthase TruD, partial [Candidatus Heimdallarchaeota archaeon]
LDWISKIWKIPRNNLSIAGTKDKKALTAQRVSLWGTKEKFEQGRLRNLDFPTMKTKAPCLRLNEIRLGNLWGNFFDIIIRNIKSTGEETKKIIFSTLDEIESKGGILNGFGLQRFGEQRPITHIVGKKLLEEDVRGAIKIYIGKVFEGESDEVKEARTRFWETENARDTLNLLPSHLRIEKKLLNLLNRRKNDYLQAFNSLPNQFQKLFIHAYQSYLFNNYLRIRIENYSDNLKKPLAGEVIKEGNICVPLVGAKTHLDREVEEIYNEIFEMEKISKEDFLKPFIKKIGGKGALRSISFKPEKLQIIDSGNDELNEKRSKIRLSFEIKKGSYATEFLREIMKL